MIDNKTLKLNAAIHAMVGFCSSTPMLITPSSDVNEILGAWNRWYERLQQHYIPQLVEALEEFEK